MTPTATDRARKAVKDLNRLVGSCQQGEQTILRIAEHCSLVAGLLSDAAYWSREAVDDGEMIEDERDALMYQAASANLALAEAMLAVLA